MNQDSRWIVLAVIIGSFLCHNLLAQITQTSSVADGMGARSTGGSFTHIGAGGQPGGIATSRGGSYYNQAGFLNTFFLKPGLDTDGNGIPDEADWDNDGDLLSDLDEIIGGLFNPTSPTNPNNVDSDGDGMSDYQEMIAGTDPNNPDALLEVIHIATAGGGQEVRWVARGGKTYIVQARLDPTAGAFAPLATNLAVGGSAPWFVVTNSFVDLTSTNTEFYAVQVLP
ncbi:MAG TPA: hypothetical protein PKE26_11475 [Kiritimatiellia bacterium]|nr:hypothetical protein [Kiritimatiellia bacterium]HMO99721.1 hypothetical protein [Kiritimatiellia bacterium]HMP97420.1 hypothetical protein [Kiritimatiellia bacterium]